MKKIKNDELFSSGTCHLEGTLFLPSLLRSVFLGKAVRQTDEDYDLPPGLKFQDECSRAFRIFNNAYKIFESSTQNASEIEKWSVTRKFVIQFFKAVLGYDVKDSAPKVISERSYPILTRVNSLPLVIVSSDYELDEIVDRLKVEERKKSAFSLCQEYLNASDDDLWGFVCNGTKVRLLRDSLSFSRPSYLEFDLSKIANNSENGAYSEFTDLYHFLHSSRTIKIDSRTVWDDWKIVGENEGQRVKDGLSDNVRLAISVLGKGFISNKNNEALRNSIKTGALSNQAFLNELLCLMYRFIFVFCLEERDLLNTDKKDTTNYEHYLKGYSFKRFKNSCRLSRFYNSFNDAYESAKIVFKSLANGEKRLSLPALGGLFKTQKCYHLKDCSLSNDSFFEAMRLMRWATTEGDVLTLIDYRNMGSEELGSVYESLLELSVQIDCDLGEFSFIGYDNAKVSKKSTQGSERKNTGSFYTPDCLVQELIKSALEPSLNKKIKSSSNPEQAILSFKVIDPACGSGHFLLAAARRIAQELASIRSGYESVSPIVYRQAIYDVIKNCIYGVDLNEQAIELAKMALWLEGYCEGRPLSFIDSHLIFGNSIFGVFDLNVLKTGIPSEAYSPRKCDDKDVCAQYKKENINFLSKLEEISTQTDLFLSKETDDVFEKIQLLDSKTENTVEDVEQKESLFKGIMKAERESSIYCACDLYTASFLITKNTKNESLIPTSKHIFSVIHDKSLFVENSADNNLLRYAQKICEENHVLHWPLIFPFIKITGFDCILANPPWEKAKMEAQPFFLNRFPVISQAENASKRNKMIGYLSEGKLSSTGNKIGDSIVFESQKQLYKEFTDKTSMYEGISNFTHLKKEKGGRFPLSGIGDCNLFALFTELVFNLSSKNENSLAGLVVPRNIATGDATKLLFEKLADGNLVSLYDFENRLQLFPIHSSYTFCLLTIGKCDKACYAFYLHDPKEIGDERREFSLNKDDIALLNPNSLNAPVFRSNKDFSIAKKIYQNSKILYNEHTKENPWKLDNLSMFHMTNDSYLFKDSKLDDCVPLYEGKLMHQYDCRFATYCTDDKGKLSTKNVEYLQKVDPSYVAQFHFYINENEVKKRYQQREWTNKWALGFRCLASATNERTLIATVFSTKQGSGNSLNMLLPNVREELASCFLANFNSIVLDYVHRLKQSDANVNLFILRQDPFLGPEKFNDSAIAFIVHRVAKLVRNCDAINECFLTNYPAYEYQSERERLELRCEIDAYIAMLYGLSYEELNYILDPSDVVGDDYPSVTFPTLKSNEISNYGEYLTKRLVLENFQKITNGELL